MRYIALAALALHGCAFLYIPGKSSPEAEGNACVQESAYIGQQIKDEKGRTGTLRRTIGRSSRCQAGSHPILGVVDYG